MSPEDEREFREFVTARSPALLRTAYLLAGDAHGAQDLLQAALMGTARHWSRIRRRDQPDAYVRRAMVNQQARWWRQRARRAESPVAVPPERAVAGDHAEQVADRHEVLDALRRLPARQRAVVVLRYYEDRPEAEVAALLGVSPGTVRSQASKALAKLRALDASHTPTPQEAWS
ncbi:RNA polymerase sigma-E factor [Actinosynnema sp. ALI-1.44]